jgi:hypothetical protein
MSNAPKNDSPPSEQAAPPVSNFMNRIDAYASSFHVDAVTGMRSADTKMHRDAIERAITRLAEQAAREVSEPKHATKESGDCPHWCPACAVEAKAREASAHPAAPQPAMYGRLTEDGAFYLGDAPQPASAQVAEPVAWRPIETAPREHGKLLLGWVWYTKAGEDDDGEAYEQACSTVDFIEWQDGGEHGDGYWLATAGPWGGYSDGISHWMPLPAAPGAAPSVQPAK